MDAKWPTPFDCSECVPSIDPYDNDPVSLIVLAFELNTETWGEAFYDHAESQWVFCDSAAHDKSFGVTHWLPMPKKPKLPAPPSAAESEGE